MPDIIEKPNRLRQGRVMSIEQGWWCKARREVSPNQDARPQEEVSLLVLHSISLPPRSFGGPYIEQLFTNRLETNEHPFFATIEGVRVSAHLLIRRGGECVQFVPFTRRAWHAGRSGWREGTRVRNRVNDFSIGIELEGDEVTPYPEPQYRALAEVTAALCHRYPDLTPERITSHAHIAPERKTDPGPAFDWAFYRRCLAHVGVV